MNITTTSEFSDLDNVNIDSKMIEFNIAYLKHILESINIPVPIELSNINDDQLVCLHRDGRVEFFHAVESGLVVRGVT